MAEDMRTVHLMRVTSTARERIREFARGDGSQFKRVYFHVAKFLEAISTSLAKHNFTWRQAYERLSDEEHRIQKSSPEEIDFLDIEKEFLEKLHDVGDRDERVCLLGAKLARFIHSNESEWNFLETAKPSLAEEIKQVLFEILLVSAFHAQKIRAEREAAAERIKAERARMAQILQAEVEAELEAIASIEKIEELEDRHKDYARLEEQLRSKFGNRLDKFMLAYINASRKKKLLAKKEQKSAELAHAETVHSGQYDRVA